MSSNNYNYEVEDIVTTFRTEIKNWKIKKRKELVRPKVCSEYPNDKTRQKEEIKKRKKSIANELGEIVRVFKVYLVVTDRPRNGNGAQADGGIEHEPINAGTALLRVYCSGGHGHAEEQFIEWFRDEYMKDGTERNAKVELDLYLTKSPCKDCVPKLKTLMVDYKTQSCSHKNKETCGCTEPILDMKVYYGTPYMPKYNKDTYEQDLKERDERIRELKEIFSDCSEMSDAHLNPIEVLLTQSQNAEDVEQLNAAMSKLEVKNK